MIVTGRESQEEMKVLNGGGVEHLRNTDVSKRKRRGVAKAPTTRTEAPNAWGGRLDANFDFTTPEFP